MLTAKRVFVLLVAAGAGLAAAPAPDPARKAAEEYRRAEQEANELEQSFKEQRVRARSELLDKEEALRKTEREEGPRQKKDADHFLSLEARLNFLADPQSEQGVKMRRELDQLRPAKEEWEKRIRKLRRDIFDAEENLRLLDRQQNLQRRKAYAWLEAAEAKLWPGRGSAAAATDQRLQELDKKVDSLLRDMAELRRELRRPAK